MGVILGTSGWQYRSWKSAFYEDAPQREWLDKYSEAFQAVEVNNAFYRLPDKKVFEAWATETPDDFVVGVKVSRYLTHMKRLKDPAEPVARFMDRAAGLGKKLGPVLLQLPPNMKAEPERLADTLDRFPHAVRVAVELRHDTWFTDDVRHILENHGAALSWAESPKRETPKWKTTDWGYVRFHEGTGRPKPCYRPSALESWAEAIAKTYDNQEDVYAFFNNDTNVCAVRDAGRFGDLVEHAGLDCSRRPNPKAVNVG